jgi:hypothetical protein
MRSQGLYRFGRVPTGDEMGYGVGTSSNEYGGETDEEKVWGMLTFAQLDT